MNIVLSKNLIIIQNGIIFIIEWYSNTDLMSKILDELIISLDSFSQEFKSYL